MQVVSLLAEPFRENGYTLAIHGSVPAQGKGHDLDLIAVPAALAVTQPEIMERLMCELLRAWPDGEPSAGLLGDWSRAFILEDATRSICNIDHLIGRVQFVNRPTGCGRSEDSRSVRRRLIGSWPSTV